jgi:hypothetical protein
MYHSLFQTVKKFFIVKWNHQHIKSVIEQINGYVFDGTVKTQPSNDTQCTMATSPSSLCDFCCSRFAPATQGMLITLLLLLLSFCSSNSKGAHPSVTFAALILLCFMLFVSLPSHLFVCPESLALPPPPITPSIIT